MSQIKRFVIVYDISCDHERRHVEETIKGFGFRIQKSVFECQMTTGQTKQLLKALEKLQIKTGFVRLYPLQTQSQSIDIGVIPAHLNIDTQYSYVF